MSDDLKVAIVYDWIDKWGGVERVLLTLHEIFPNAIFYTSYVDLKKAPWASGLNIKTSFMQYLPNFIKKNRLLSLPFYPYAFESFDFGEYDFVISVSSSFAKSVITKPGTLHLNYVLTPTRFLWVYPDLYLKNGLLKFFFSRYFSKLKEWDLVVANRPDKLIAISQAVKVRISKYYKRDSEVIYPPFDVEYWRKIKHEARNMEHGTWNIEHGNKFKFKDYFLVVSRLEPYKRIDLAIDAFNKRENESLIIVGQGSEENNLRKRAGNNVQFVQNLTDEELAILYTNAKALIMPQEEDFGYTALEAQFFRCPVIHFAKGGACETVIDGKTGISFDKQSVESLQQALARFAKIQYNLRASTIKLGIKNVERFSKEKFIKEFTGLISNFKFQMSNQIQISNNK